MTVAVWQIEGAGAVERGAHTYVEQMVQLLPRMMMGLLIGGFGQVLVPRSLVSQWLGDSAGFKGILIATGVGAVAPGGPMVAFPLVVVLHKAGASPAAVIAFVTAWANLAFHRILIWELSVLGPEITLVRYLSSISLGIIAGLIAMPLARAVGYKSEEAS